MICSWDFNEKYGLYISLLTSERTDFNNNIIAFVYSFKNLQCSINIILSSLIHFQMAKCNCTEIIRLASKWNTLTSHSKSLVISCILYYFKSNVYLRNFSASVLFIKSTWDVRKKYGHLISLNLQVSNMPCRWFLGNSGQVVH